jgi:hypothetical protein
MWLGARPPLAPIPQPRPQQQAFVAKQQPPEAPTPALPAGAGQWAPPGFYHPMTSLPSWDTQSLASAFSTATLQQPPTNEWYFDSGATSHMTSSSSNLSHFTFSWYPTPSWILLHLLLSVMVPCFPWLAPALLNYLTLYSLIMSLCPHKLLRILFQFANLLTTIIALLSLTLLVVL